MEKEIANECNHLLEFNKVGDGSENVRSLNVDDILKLHLSGKNVKGSTCKVLDSSILGVGQITLCHTVAQNKGGEISSPSSFFALFLDK